MTSLLLFYMHHRYQNTGNGSTLTCLASATCDVTQWVIDSSDLTSGIASCSGIQDINNFNTVNNNDSNSDEDGDFKHKNITNKILK